MEIIYGPYFNPKYNRSHVIFYNTETKKRLTKSYARHLMELHLGRLLSPDEHVDHINDDPRDDRIENLQILSREENSRKSAHKGRELTKLRNARRKEAVAQRRSTLKT